MGETRVDLLHLLEDLRDAYAGALEETILTEIVANALDSGARTISVRTDPAQNALVVVDDGRGMTRRELSRYHDIAASSKTRGEGIGFAGVGIKLGLLACEEVLTETRKGAKQIATRWKLASRHRAPWRWVDAPGVVTSQGTGVCLRLRNPLSPLLDEGFLETTLRQHFESLLDARFDAALAEHYPGGVELRLNGRALEKAAKGDGAPFDVVLPRKRRPCAHGVLWRSSAPLPEDRRGVAVSTLGKVIRRGWDWLGLTPLTPDHVGGLIEAPVLAEALTLNKADFLRSGARGMLYLGVRKAIQQAVNGQLRAWGEGRDPEEEARRRAARPLERDLEAVLIDLAEDFPALAPLVERRAGGQTRLPGGGSARGAGAPAFDSASEATEATPAAGAEPAPDSTPEPDTTGEPAAEAPEEGQPSLDERAPLDGGSASRPQRYRLAIEFEQREDLPDIGRLSQSTVFVNTAHAAYRRAVASRSEGYHVALSVAMALAPEVAEPSGARTFIAAFLESWGQALSRDKRRRGARP